MTKNNKNKESILKSKFFVKLLIIPYIAWLLFSLLLMIPDETETDPLTWGDLILADISILLIWFIITYVIALIINELKKRTPKPKIIKEVQYITKPDTKIIANIDKKEETKRLKKLNTNCLYTCESIVDSYEYKKMAKYFPNKMYWVFVIRGTYFNLLISAVIAIFSKSLVGTLTFLIIYQISLMILYKVRLEHVAEKEFNAQNKRGETDINYETEFYKDYFIRKSEKLTRTINYSEINRCIENDTNFYLEYSQRNLVIIIQKNRCDLELINFIRDTFPNLENHLGDTSQFKGVKKYHNPNLIKNGMLLLFIITILSLSCASWSVSLIDKINPQHGFNFSKNYWIMWCWLPMPILSIILGFKYKKAGFKCTKNIVVGFIVGFLLLINGTFCLSPNFSQDYSKINNYKNIIDAKLPNNGELEIQNWGTYFDEDKTNYIIINAYYDKENVDNLVNSIEHSSNWILSKEIKSELKVLIPSQFFSDDDAFFSIYNKTTNEYNSIPSSSGDYEIYAMRYDKSDKYLTIHNFKYNYKK